MPTIQTRAGRVAYAESGCGPTVLLLHATLHDRHDFDPIVKTLARRYRTIAVDWPGHGDSDAIPAVIEPGAPLFADVLEDVVDGLEVSRAVLIGNSVGGFAAARVRSVESLVPDGLPADGHARGFPPGRSPVRPWLHEG
jgi:pimeloyl-ACP methyl ester carboxylesterase